MCNIMAQRAITTETSHPYIHDAQFRSDTTFSLLIRNFVSNRMSCLRTFAFSTILHLKNSPYNRSGRPTGGVHIDLYSFFNLGSRWWWVVNSTTQTLYPRENRPDIHCLEAGWAQGPVSSKSHPHRNSIPGPSSP